MPERSPLLAEEVLTAIRATLRHKAEKVRVAFPDLADKTDPEIFPLEICYLIDFLAGNSLGWYYLSVAFRDTLQDLASRDYHQGLTPDVRNYLTKNEAEKVIQGIRKLR